MTIILTTHYLEEAESLCRNIAIIDEGKIIENDSISNIVKKLSQQSFIFNLSNSCNKQNNTSCVQTKTIPNLSVSFFFFRRENP